jgi:hypothetical protein
VSKLHAFRITSRVGFFLEGTQAWVDRADLDDNPGEKAARSLMRKLDQAPVRKDRSCTLQLTDEELDMLDSYVGAFAAGAADNTWDVDGRADLAAARGAQRQLTKLGVEVW